MATQNMPEGPGSAEQWDVAAFHIDVLDEHFTPRRVTLHDPMPQGRQIATAAGFGDDDDVVVLEQFAETNIRRVGPNDLVDLRDMAAKRFFVIHGDRTFLLTIDRCDLEWPRSKVNAETVLRLAQKGREWHVYQRVDGEADREIGADETLDLGHKGIEHFVTKHHITKVTVFYNHEPVELPHGTYTTEQLLVRFGVPAGYILDLISPDGEFIELKPGREIQIKEGQQFVSHAPCGQSS